MSLIGKSIGNYVIQSQLGEGGMGAVYLGTHPLIGKRVAVKVLLEELSSSPDIVARFFREAKSVNDIGHQNIVDIVDFGSCRLDGATADTVYLIMEFLDGDSLAGRIRRQRFGIGDVLHVMQQCCSGLAASHAKGIVHRDLKPENIYVVTRGGDSNFVKILDFGIAKLTGDGGGVSKTRTGMVIGTPIYMSPEQCEGRGNLDARSDIYSLGVVMYEMLTGRTPFLGEGFGEILLQHMTKAPPPPSQLNPAITPEIEAIVLRTLEKSPHQRFQSMAELDAALRAPELHYQQHGAATMSGIRDAATLSAMTAPGMRKTGPHGPLAVTAAARPTTLSGAAAEVDSSTAPRAGRSSGGGMFAALALVILAGGGVAFWKSRSATAPTPVSAAPAPVAAAPEADVRITVDSDPPGATVVRPGLPNQKTPATLLVKRGSESFDVTVQLDGFKPTILRNVATSQDAALHAALEKVPAPTVAAPARPTVSAPPHKPTVSKPGVSKPRHGSSSGTPDEGGLVDVKF